MKFLIDECLSPDLALLAREQGFSQSTHVTWLGLTGAKDHAIARHAIDEGYVFVTHNTVDFRPLYAREEIHLGLVGFNTAARMMDLNLQKSLLLQAIIELSDTETYHKALEISVAADGTVTIDHYRIPPI